MDRVIEKVLCLYCNEQLISCNNEIYTFLYLFDLYLWGTGARGRKIPYVEVELSGALNNNSAWEVEPSVTYLPIPYVGITMGLLFCNTIEKDSYTGFSRDNQWFWDSDESNPAVISLRYVRPSS